MWTARFKRFETLLVAALRAKRRESASDTARVIAYVEERLQNSFLLSTHATHRSAADHDSFQVRPQGAARHSCRAH